MRVVSGSDPPRYEPNSRRLSAARKPVASVTSAVTSVGPGTAKSIESRDASKNREHKAKRTAGRPCAKVRPVAAQGKGGLVRDSGGTLIGNKQVEPSR